MNVPPQNVMQQSSNAYTGALGGTQGAYNAYAGTQNQGAQAADPAAIAAGYATYKNPYTQDVINATTGQMQQVTGQQQAANAANAMQSGAFGGGRQGVVEALTNAQGQMNVGQMAAGLNNQGFETAMGLSAQDVANRMGNNQFNAGMINDMYNRNLGAAGGMLNAAGQAGNLSQQGFNYGRQINADQSTQGSAIQQLQQKLIDAANGQFAGTTGQPQNALNTMLAALGMSPLQGNSTTTGQYKPGMMDYASMFAQMMGGMK
jgi:hypothetical protein